MSTEAPVIEISGLDVDVVRKDIKNLHIGVYPPFGRVRVSAPRSVDDEAIRLAVISRLAWIRKRRERIRKQARQSRREMVDGEAHYVWGRSYRLRVVEDGARQAVRFGGGDWLELHVAPGASRDARERRLGAWYRAELRKEIPPLIDKWAPRLGVAPSEWRIKRMKTKWGTCNVEARRIWINLELAKKPKECLEFIVVHEMIHLLEAGHTRRFYQLQDRFMPSWRQRREVLNAMPLADEVWPADRWEIGPVQASRGSALSPRSGRT